MAETITAPPAAPTPAPVAPTNAQPKPGQTAPPAAPVKLEVIGGEKPGATKETPGKEGEIKKDPDAANLEKPYKIKVNGKEYALTLEEALTLAQKGVGADKKFNEAHKIKTQAEQFIHLLKTDPMAILNNPNIGFDFKKAAQDFLAKEIDLEMMTPEQRELHDLKEKLKASEDDKKKQAETEHQEKMERLVAHYSTEYEKDITSTLQTAGLPKTRGTVKRIAYYMDQGLRRGVPLKAADVVDLVRSDIIQEHNELYGAADGDTLLKMFGDPTIKKLMEANLKRIQGGAPVTPTQPSAPASSQPVEKLSKDEWRKQLDAKVARG